VAAFIATQRARYGIPHAVSCRALGVSQAWLYKWRRGDVSKRRARRQALAAAIAALFARHKGTYGSPRITADLNEAGWRVSVNTVAAVMVELGLVARPKRKRRGLTKPDKAARKAPDLLKRNFAAPAVPNVAWVGDLTGIPNDEGALRPRSIRCSPRPASRCSRHRRRRRRRTLSRNAGCAPCGASAWTGCWSGTVVIVNGS
jgi:putative transposase